MAQTSEKLNVLHLKLPFLHFSSKRYHILIELFFGHILQLISVTLLRFVLKKPHLSCFLFVFDTEMSQQVLHSSRFLGVITQKITDNNLAMDSFFVLEKAGFQHFVPSLFSVDVKVVKHIIIITNNNLTWCNRPFHSLKRSLHFLEHSPGYWFHRNPDTHPRTDPSLWLPARACYESVVESFAIAAFSACNDKPRRPECGSAPLFHPLGCTAVPTSCKSPFAA